jgi:uncharacterized protein (TIGR03663 family)
MMEPGHNRASLQRPLLGLLRLDAERAIYIAIFLLAIASRFWDLGARAISFDECTHALWSYKLYNGEGFTHDPMMHGPFLFHANALVYFLFGDNDYTSRIVPAVFGVFLVMSPLLLRRWLGRLGALLSSVLLLMSPTILTYSRYLRNDVYMLVWMVLLTAALFHLLEDRRPRWFVIGGAVLMLSLATKENAYFFGYIGLVFLGITMVWERARPRHRRWLALGGAALSVALLVAAYQLQRPLGEGSEATSDLLKLAVALLTVVGATLPAALASARLIPSRQPGRSRVEEAIRAMPRRAWLAAGAAMLLIYTLLFSGFFTNSTGLATGIVGSLSYWLAQQDVERGSQPWYYYGLLLGMYDFLPLLLGLTGLGTYLVRGRHAQEPAHRGDTETVPDGADLSVQAPSSASDPARIPDAQASQLGTHDRRGGGHGAVERRTPSTTSLFRAFLVFWTLTSLFLYAWAGERMPWMVVHQTLPLVLLAGTFAGELVGRILGASSWGTAPVTWRSVWHPGGAILALLLPAVLFGIYRLVQLQEAQSLLIGIPMTLFLLLLTAITVWRLGARRTVLVTAATLLAGLCLLTVRFAWMAAYINYDYATELLVYAHGTPDVTLTMEEIAAISQRTVSDKLIEVAYDQEAAWPLEWYLREYPNRKFYGTTPTRELLDAPVVLASAEIDNKVRPFLGERYDRFRRSELWWPNQQYMGLTWARIRDILTSPEQRRTLWDILFHRRYPRSPDDWYHVDYVYLYIRKDVAQKLWDLGAHPPGIVELPPDIPAEVQVDLTAERIWGEPGTGPGQFTYPRGVAIGAEGSVYVVDSGNHRIQVFDRGGTFLRAWGSLCALDSGQGCTDPDGAGPLVAGDGQFHEPWGIAVSPDGRVYVADTWNHRIQAFESDGAFLAKWGSFGETADLTQWFYGPRDVAVEAEDRVFVTDTGNERVMVFAADGQYLTQWGVEGIIPGAFAEPVGLDLDAGGNVYVADTWNRRVQVFDLAHTFLREWPVEGWYGESVANKPYLAVDPSGRVYVTDPEGARVVVFSRTGELLATFGHYGLEEGSFQTPTGIAIDAEGHIYVTDADGQRVLRFEPLP